MVLVVIDITNSFSKIPDKRSQIATLGKILGLVLCRKLEPCLEPSSSDAATFSFLHKIISEETILILIPYWLVGSL